MVYKITIDGGLLRAQIMHPAVRQLKMWESEGKVELFESDRSKEPSLGRGWPGGPKGPRRPIPSKKKVPGQLSFSGVSAVLFPSRDSQRLSMTEVNCVAHLLSHRLQERAFFVTNNIVDFIAKGKKDLILRALKIVVLTPEEAVETIGRLIMSPVADAKLAK